MNQYQKRLNTKYLLMKSDPYYSQKYPDSSLNNHPFHHLVLPFKLPTILDIIRESLESIKNVELKEDQTPLFYSLCHVLTELPLIGDKILLKAGSQYHSNLFVSPTGEVPKISITDYLTRLVKFSPCSKECFIMIVVYFDRIIKKTGFIINSLNIHRLLITSIMVASKYIDDIFYNNEYYSHIGGVTRDELNRLEISFLNLLQFDLSCPLPDYLDYFSKLDSFVSKLRKQNKKESIIKIHHHNSILNNSINNNNQMIINNINNNNNNINNINNSNNMNINVINNSNNINNCIPKDNSIHNNSKANISKIINTPTNTSISGPSSDTQNIIISTSRRKSLTQQNQLIIPKSNTCIS